MTSYREKLSAMLRENGLPLLLGITAAVGLKYHYSVADAEGLLWMLSPVARLVVLLSSTPFQWELYTEFVSFSRGIRIAPACAGINFMIICFAALFFPLVHRLPGRAVKLSWLWLSLAVAYLATLLTNTARILISIRCTARPSMESGLRPKGSTDSQARPCTSLSWSWSISRLNA